MMGSLWFPLETHQQFLESVMLRSGFTAEEGSQNNETHAE